LIKLKLAERLASPFGRGPSHMAAELTPGALDGIVGKLVYSPPFGDL
jgi:putative acetyltransferase